MTQPTMSPAELQKFEKMLSTLGDYVDAISNSPGDKQKKRYTISPIDRQYVIDTWLPVLYVVLPGMKQSFVDRPDLAEHTQRIIKTIRSIFEEQIRAKGMHGLTALMPFLAMMEQRDQES